VRKPSLLDKVYKARIIYLISGMMDKTLLDWAAPRSRKVFTIIYGNCKDLISYKDLQIYVIYDSRRPEI